MDVSQSRPLVILKTGDTHEPLRTPRGDFEHWIADGLGTTHLPLVVLDPRRGDGLPHAGQVSGVIVSGSHDMVSHRAAWSEDAAQWIAGLVHENVPLLGICYGHQLLAHALGGVADDHPQALEIGTVAIETTEAAAADALLGSLPHRFDAHVVHRQSALSLPADATVLARNDFEPHQAFRVGDCAWGVQFHPEFDDAAMRGYIDILSQDLERAGRDAAKLRQSVRPTPDAAALLRRFAQFVETREAAAATAPSP